MFGSGAIGSAGHSDCQGYRFESYLPSQISGEAHPLNQAGLSPEATNKRVSSAYLILVQPQGSPTLWGTSLGSSKITLIN